MRYRLNFDTKLADLDGKPIRAGVNARVLEAINQIAAELEQEPREKLAKKLDEIWGEEQTLRSVCVTALLEPNAREKDLGAEEKERRYQLARRIIRACNKEPIEPVEYNDKERDLLKRVIDLYYLGALMGPLVGELLEGAERQTEEIKGAQAGRASIAAVLAMLLLSGCTAATLYVNQHAAGLAATGLVAGTASQVSGALINADELERRAERRIDADADHKDNNNERQEKR
jgi:hypothetical protein